MHPYLIWANKHLDDYPYHEVWVHLRINDKDALCLTCRATPGV